MSYACKRIAKKICDGCMECAPDPRYFCPVCGEEVYEAVFVANSGEVLGCDNCAQIKEPYEVIEDEIEW